MAKDLFHDAVKNSLIKDGWQITDDPFLLKVGGVEIFVYDIENEVIVTWKI
jgi:hypothetical protein